MTIVHAIPTLFQINNPTPSRGKLSIYFIKLRMILWRSLCLKLNTTMPTRVEALVGKTHVFDVLL